jgi:hypothetical protein
LFFCPEREISNDTKWLIASYDLVGKTFKSFEFIIDTKAGPDMIATIGMPPSGLTMLGIIMSLFSPTFIVYSVPSTVEAYSGARFSTSTEKVKGFSYFPSHRITFIVCIPQLMSEFGSNIRTGSEWIIGKFGEATTYLMETGSPSASGLINPEMSYGFFSPLVITMLGRGFGYSGRLLVFPTSV